MFNFGFSRRNTALPRANLVVKIPALYPFVDRIGKHDGPAQLRQFAEVVSGTVTFYHPAITGAEIIESSGGDAPVSVVAGGIVIGVGKAWSIKDNAGHHWSHCAALSPTSVVMWDVSGLGDHLIAEGSAEDVVTALCSTSRDLTIGTDWLDSGFALADGLRSFLDDSGSRLLPIDTPIPCNAAKSSVALTDIDTELIVPSFIFGVVGTKTRIGINNSLKNFIGNPEINIGGSVGILDQSSWIDLNPSIASNNSTVLFDQVNDAKHAKYKVATSVTTGGLNVLVIGDSTVAGGNIVNGITAKSTADGSPLIRFIGTKGISPNLHEGISGWTISNFYIGVTSPFYSASGFAVGFASYCAANGTPDVIIIKLGINDFYSKQSDALVDTAVATAISTISAMIVAFKDVNPSVRVGIDMTGGPSSQALVAIDYGALPAYRIRRNFQIFNKALVNTAWGDNVDVLHGNLAITIPVNYANGLHPNSAGYAEIANHYYAWIKNKITTLDNYLGWHNSEYDKSTRLDTKTSGIQHGDIVTQTYSWYSFNGVGFRFACSTKRNYEVNVKFTKEAGTTSSVYIGVLLWNGSAAVAYNIPAEKCGAFVTYLGKLNYYATGDYVVGSWNILTTTVDLSEAPDFDSISIHVSGYGGDATGIFTKTDLRGTHVRAI